VADYNDWKDRKNATHLLANMLRNVPADIVKTLKGSYRHYQLAETYLSKLKAWAPLSGKSVQNLRKP
jgi:hypothetical protein